MQSKNTNTNRTGFVVTIPFVKVVIIIFQPAFLGARPEWAHKSAVHDL
jgi:hypothetical protein